MLGVAAVTWIAGGALGCKGGEELMELPPPRLLAEKLKGPIKAKNKTKKQTIKIQQSLISMASFNKTSVRQ